MLLGEYVMDGNDIGASGELWGTSGLRSSGRSVFPLDLSCRVVPGKQPHPARARGFVIRLSALDTTEFSKKPTEAFRPKSENKIVLFCHSAEGRVYEQMRCFK